MHLSHALPLPRSIAHTACFSRQKKHGLWNAAQRGQYPICIDSIPIADRNVNVCLNKNENSYEIFSWGECSGRCRWQMKRGERVAAVKISSARRKAAQKFWAPQQDIAAEIDTKNMPPACFLNVSTPACFLNVSTDSHASDIGHWLGMTM